MSFKIHETELKEKLAIFAGFRLSKMHYGYCYPPNKTYRRQIPDFPNDIKACFAYIVPQLQDKGYMVELFAYEHSEFRVTIISLFYEPISQVRHDNPALALCLATVDMMEGLK